MIRRQISLSPQVKGEISYNYQHEILKNIYKLMKLVDKEGAAISHNKGYRLDSGHIFKLFNYTLLFEGAEFANTGIRFNKNTKIKLVLSGKKEIIETILKGFLVSPKIEIDNLIFDFKGVGKDKRVYFEEVTFYKALSPIVVSTKTNEGNKEYLTPYNERYFENLVNNLKRKYKLIYKKEYKGEIFFEIDNLLEMKNKFIKFKNGGMKGQEYSIWIQADKDMQKVIYYLGLGQNSSTGCGCLSFITGVKDSE